MSNEELTFPNVVIDPEFSRLLAPLDGDERRLLENSIICEGVRDSLVLWGDSLVDGHNRYAICTELGIPFSVSQLDVEAARASVLKEWPVDDPNELSDRAIVGLWIILNQSGRRNISPYTRCKLQFEVEKRLPGRPNRRPTNEEKTSQNSANLPPTDRRKDAAKLAGVSHDTYARAKAINRALDEKKIDSAVIEKLERGEESINAVYQSIVGPPKTLPHVSNNSGEHEWYTPVEFIDAARAVMGSIDLDPASSDIAQKTVKASVYYTKDDDGLAKTWSGKVWMNPPYAQPLCGRFAHKLSEDRLNGGVTDAVVLVNNATDTKWFRELADVSSAICFISGRVKFLDPDGNPGAPLQGQAVLYIGADIEEFASEFSAFGFVVFTQ